MTAVAEQIGRELVLALDGSFRTEYLIDGADSEEEAMFALVAAGLPAFTATGLAFQSTTFTEMGDGVWKAVASYGIRRGQGATQQARIPGQPSDGSKPGLQSSPGDDLVFDFDTGHGSQKISNSIKTTARYERAVDAASGNLAPNLKGIIGANGQQVEGTEVEVAATTFTTKARFTGGFVTHDFIRGINANAFTVNKMPWKGYGVREVKFLGCTGSQKGTGDPEISFRWAYSPTVTRDYGDVLGVTKPGWDYLWIRYVDAKVGNNLVKVPQYVYVEQVYLETDFNLWIP